MKSKYLVILLFLIFFFMGCFSYFSRNTQSLIEIREKEISDHKISFLVSGERFLYDHNIFIQSIFDIFTKESIFLLFNVNSKMVVWKNVYNSYFCFKAFNITNGHILTSRNVISLKDGTLIKKFNIDEQRYIGDARCLYINDGKNLISASHQEGTLMWDTHTYKIKKRIYEVEFMTERVIGLAYNSKLKQIYFLSEDGKLNIVDSLNFNLIKSAKIDSKLFLIDINEAGNFMVAHGYYGDRIKIYELPSITYKNEIETNEVSDSIISHDGKYIATIEGKHTTIIIRKMATGEEVTKIGPVKGIHYCGINFTKDNKYISSTTLINEFSASVVIWRLDGTEIFEYRLPRKYNYGWSADLIEF